MTLYAKQIKKRTENEVSTSPAEYDKLDYAVAWVNFQLFDHHGYLKCGNYTIGVWPDEKPKPSSSSIENHGETGIPTQTVCIEFESFSLPVVFPTKGEYPKVMKQEFEEWEKEQKERFPSLQTTALKKELDR
jgi:hypothetical protein